MRRWLYQIVLREASRPEDLTSYLDRDTLIAVWPELHLPKGVRRVTWDGLMPSVTCTGRSPHSHWSWRRASRTTVWPSR